MHLEWVRVFIMKVWTSGPWDLWHVSTAFPDRWAWMGEFSSKLIIIITMSGNLEQAKRITLCLLRKKNLHNLEHLISMFLVFKLIPPLNSPFRVHLIVSWTRSLTHVHFTSLETYSLPALVTGVEDVLSLLPCMVGCFSLSPCHSEDKPLSLMQRQPQRLREAG